MNAKQKRIRIAIAWAIGSISVPSMAAYRVYQLKVTPLDEKNRPLKTQVRLTTLDPYQYESTHGFGKVRVVLTDSWFCPGDTSSKDYCPKPKDKRLQRGPAGLFAPKRKNP